MNAKIIDTDTEEVLKSFEIEKPYKEEVIFDVTDSLRKKVTDFLLITKLGDELPSVYGYTKYTNSPEAYRYFIYGNNAFFKREYPTATDWYLKALATDSNFFVIPVFISISYLNQSLYDEGKYWCLKNYDKRDLMAENLWGTLSIEGLREHTIKPESTGKRRNYIGC